MLEDLKDKRVVVTAAASGIGRHIAEGFLAAGARLYVCDVDEAALQDFLRQHDRLDGVLADVSERGQVDRLFDGAEAALGGLDVMVNNAGIAGPTAPLEEVDFADWRRTLEVNLDGMFHCLQRAVPLLKAAGPGGSVVNLSSAAGVFGFPRRTPYAASKWAVVGLTKSLAHELGPFGIRVNAICPGAVAGPRIDRVIAAEAAASGRDEAEVRANYASLSALQTFVEPEDIANMALFLCSGAGARISGQALSVDAYTDTLAR